MNAETIHMMTIVGCPLDISTIVNSYVYINPEILLQILEPLKISRIYIREDCVYNVTELTNTGSLSVTWDQDNNVGEYRQLMGLSFFELLSRYDADLLDVFKESWELEGITIHVWCEGGTIDISKFGLTETICESCIYGSDESPYAIYEMDGIRIYMYIDVMEEYIRDIRRSMRRN